MHISTNWLGYQFNSFFAEQIAHKRFVLFQLLLLLSIQSQAQDPYFSQFYASTTYLNPALVGVEKDTYFGLNYRTQWSSAGTPFTTGQFSFITPIGKNNPTKFHRNGLGFSAYKDVAGESKQYKTNGITLSFAHDIVFGSDFTQIFSFGGQAGIIQKRISYDELQWGSQYDPSMGFNPGLVSSASQFADQLWIPVINYGVVWYNNPQKNNSPKSFSSFVGFVASNLNRPNESMLTDELNRLPILFKLHGGAEWSLSEYVYFSPNFLIMQQNNVRQYNIGSYFTYKANINKTSTTTADFMLGVWYRVKDSFILSTGTQLKNYSVGFSYDLNVSTLRYYTRGKGAYEISIAYRISQGPQIKKVFNPAYVNMSSRIVKNSTVNLLVLLLCLSNCCLFFPTYGQNAYPKRQLKQSLFKANYYSQHELYFKAAKYYEIASSLSPEDSKITYCLAECHRHLFNYKLAEKEYGKVYYADLKNHPATLFYYALMQKYNKKYGEAIKNFETFITDAIKNESADFLNKKELLERAKLEKEGCKFALSQLLLPWREFNFTTLPQPVISDFHDYAPIILDNDSSLVITSGRPNASGNFKDIKLGESLTDMYRFRLDNNQWIKNEDNDGFESINTSWSDGTGSFNITRDKFYFTSCYEENSSCKIYFTSFKNGKWAKPVKLNLHINSPNFDSRQPALSPNGDTLYFVSNRPGGFGLNDIWMSVNSGHENWGAPVNLGIKINTPQQEISPFFNTTENTFFFASNGHIGLGGLDIFMMSSADSTPVNLGFPINSDKDDCFFTMGTSVGYLSSNRAGNTGTFNIYSFQLKSNETVLALINKDQLGAKTDLTYLALYNLEYLPAEDKLAVDRIVSRKEAGRIYKNDLPLDKEDAFFYEKLSEEEKKQIERIIESRISQMTESDLSVLKGQDEFYYENLSTEDKERIDRMAKAFLQAKITNQDIQLTEKDAFHYQKLSYEDKQRLNRIIASRINEKTNDLIDPTTLADEDRFYYENLPTAEKERINRMIAAKRLQQENGEDVALNQEDAFYYSHLSEEEKKTVNRIIANQLTNAIASSDKTALREQNNFQYQHIPISEKNRIQNQVSRIKTSEKVNADDTLWSTIGEPYSANPSNTFSMGNYNNVSISGRLMETATKTPAIGIKVPLVDGQGNIIKTILTSEDGSFKYTNLPLDETYKLLLETPSTKLIEPNKYYVENLQVVGYEEAPIAINLKNIYFDFNKFTLRDESIDILNKLAAFYQRFPDLQIELYAYTDNIGSNEYNLVLSRKRGEAVLNYLLQKGIPSNALVVNAKGKSNPATSNEDSIGRKNNRRVEFLIKGGPLLYNQDIKTYILPSKTSLESIANDTGMTVEALKELNNLTSDFIEPYQPIKVRSHKKGKSTDTSR